MAQHAILSPSSAERWLTCHGAPAMERGLPDNGTDYSDEGTAAHFLASECLGDGACHPAGYLGRTVFVGHDEDTGFDGATFTPPPAFDIRRAYKVDTDMAGYVNHYVQAVRHLANDAILLVEQRLSISTYTGEEGAAGTSDAVVITQGGELQVHDLKYGMTKVDAKENQQLMLYALGALEEYGTLADISGVRLFIHQPRLGAAPSEWACSLEALTEFGEHVKAQAFHARQVLALEDPGAYIHHLHPSEAACRWCKAQAHCPALAGYVAETVGAEFEDLTKADAPAAVPTGPALLGQKMAACGLIEKWIKAVRAAVEAELFAGRPVPGYKLVQGKKGNRKWADAGATEAALKAMRLKLDEMYSFSLLSPTQVEKRLKPWTDADGKTRDPILGPRQWAKVAPLITQDEGSPSVAPESDSRPPLVIDHAAAFVDETGGDLA